MGENGTLPGARGDSPVQRQGSPESGQIEFY